MEDRERERRFAFAKVKRTTGNNKELYRRMKLSPIECKIPRSSREALNERRNRITGWLLRTEQGRTQHYVRLSWPPSQQMVSERCGNPEKKISKRKEIEKMRVEQVEVVGGGGKTSKPPALTPAMRKRPAESKTKVRRGRQGRKMTPWKILINPKRKDAAQKRVPR
ncbi:hypothetical protein KM043_005077 [Ampulex compressa]|nr:hypothetical protein KM043_005077 [Ampulex compressa]